MRTAKTASWLAAGLCLTALFGCPKGNCPRGQGPREEYFRDSEQVHGRGCADKEPPGNGRFQGRWEYFYKDGKKEAEGEYKNGDPSGQRSDTGIVKDGREGVWTLYYPTGERRQVALYVAGKREGPATEWHHNGKKKWEGTFKAGVEVPGTFTEFDQQGQPVQPKKP